MARKFFVVCYVNLMVTTCGSSFDCCCRISKLDLVVRPPRRIKLRSVGWNMLLGLASCTRNSSLYNLTLDQSKQENSLRERLAWKDWLLLLFNSESLSLSSSSFLIVIGAFIICGRVRISFFELLRRALSNRVGFLIMFVLLRSKRKGARLSGLMWVMNACRLSMLTRSGSQSLKLRFRSLSVIALKQLS